LRAILNLLADDPLGKHSELAVADHEDIPAEYHAAFEAIAADARNQLVVAEIGGEVVGCFQLSFIPGLTYHGGEWATVESVRVARAMRGRGIGKAMMQHAIRLAKTRGCVKVQLTTDKRRAEAHAFYRSLGFVASHEGMMLKL
jgi:GNAT superfamily N-acetyltransferase